MKDNNNDWKVVELDKMSRSELTEILGNDNESIDTLLSDDCDEESYNKAISKLMACIQPSDAADQDTIGILQSTGVLNDLIKDSDNNCIAVSTAKGTQVYKVENEN